MARALAAAVVTAARAAPAVMAVTAAALAVRAVAAAVPAAGELVFGWPWWVSSKRSEPGPAGASGGPDSARRRAILAIMVNAAGGWHVAH